MNYKELIKYIQEAPEELGKEMMVVWLAQDENIIPALIRMLDSERSEKKKLIQDMNLELSRTAVCLEDRNMLKNKGPWILEQVKEFYRKWEDRITCCFKLEGIK